MKSSEHIRKDLNEKIDLLELEISEAGEMLKKLNNETAALKSALELKTSRLTDFKISLTTLKKCGLYPSATGDYFECARCHKTAHSSHDGGSGHKGGDSYCHCCSP